MHVLSLLGNFSTFPQGLLIGFPALFSITDPLGNSVIFSQMTADRSHAERRLMARRVGLYAVIVLIFALWVGAPALTFFGVTLPALKVGGGLVVAASGWRLLYSPETAEKETPDALQTTRVSASDMAFFPITMPLVVGPGAISVAITLGAAQPADGLDIAYLLGLSLAAIIIAAAVSLLFTYAELIGRVLGKAGSRAVKRIVALLLLTIGVQIAAFGLQNIMIPFVQSAFHGPAGTIAGP